MRNDLIGRLNEALDTDYELIEHMLLKHKTPLPSKQGRFCGDVTALSIMCELLEIKRIEPFYEGELIQRFE